MLCLQIGRDRNRMCRGRGTKFVASCISQASFLCRCLGVIWVFIECFADERGASCRCSLSSPCPGSKPFDPDEPRPYCLFFPTLHLPVISRSDILRNAFEHGERHDAPRMALNQARHRSFLRPPIIAGVVRALEPIRVEGGTGVLWHAPAPWRNCHHPAVRRSFSASRRRSWTRADVLTGKQDGG